MLIMPDSSEISERKKIFRFILMSKKDLPQYWDFLSEEDKAGYASLQTKFTPLIVRTSRDRTPKNFTTILKLLRDWIDQGDDNDWKRAIVAGIVWIDEKTIAINTRQLHCLIRKCKSTINFGLQSVGFMTIPTDGDCVSKLMKHFPFLKDRCMEMRQWTMRSLEPKKESESNDVTQQVAPVNTDRPMILPPTTDQIENTFYFGSAFDDFKFNDSIDPWTLQMDDFPFNFNGL